MNSCLLPWKKASSHTTICGAQRGSGGSPRGRDAQQALQPHGWVLPRLRLPGWHRPGSPTFQRPEDLLQCWLMVALPGHKGVGASTPVPGLLDPPALHAEGLALPWDSQIRDQELQADGAGACSQLLCSAGHAPASAQVQIHPFAKWHERQS